MQPVSLAIEELIAAAKEIQEEVKVRRNESIFHGDYGIVHASLTFSNPCRNWKIMMKVWWNILC